MSKRDYEPKPGKRYCECRIPVSTEIGECLRCLRLIEAMAFA